MSNEELLEKFRIENRKLKLDIEELRVLVRQLTLDVRASEDAYSDGEDAGYDAGWDEGFKAGVEETL